jgi:hypothetical protein
VATLEESLPLLSEAQSEEVNVLGEPLRELIHELKTASGAFEFIGLSG